MPPKLSISPSELLKISKTVPRPSTHSVPKYLQAKFRAEKDTFGDLQVPADRYWGAQTQR